jgi:hypothetical protein
MKTLFMAVVLIISLGQMTKSQFIHTAKAVKLVDYTVSYQWDNTQGDWTKPVKNQYVYGDHNRVEMTVSLDFLTMDTISRTVYVFNEDGRRTEYYTQSYNDGEWINVRKYMLVTDDDGRTLSQIVIDWKNGELVYNRKQDYYYDDNGKVSHMIYHGWNGTEWYETATEYYFYNEDGLLIGSESFDMDGVRINRWTYELNEFNKRIRRLVEGWADGDWYLSYQDLYYYDPCGNASTALRQIYRNGEWVNQSNVKYYWKYQFDGRRSTKYAVFFKGKTIYVPKNDFFSLIARGACPGGCLTENPGENTTSTVTVRQAENHLLVYPNPSSEKVTVKLKDRDCSISKIELSDMAGNIIKIMNTAGEEEVTVLRGGLADGSYILRVHADQIYSVLVVFK